jgi:hypothetical protein
VHYHFFANAAPGAVVTIDQATIPVSAQLLMTATVYDDTGNVLPGAVVTWTTTDRAIASIDRDGLVNANAVGEVTIAASYNGIVSKAQILVTPLVFNGGATFA